MRNLVYIHSALNYMLLVRYIVPIYLYTYIYIYMVLTPPLAMAGKSWVERRGLIDTLCRMHFRSFYALGVRQCTILHYALLRFLKVMTHFRKASSVEAKLCIALHSFRFWQFGTISLMLPMRKDLVMNVQYWG